MAAAPEEDGQVHTQPVFSLMRMELLESLVRFTQDGGRKVDAWTARHKTVIVPFTAAGDDPRAFFNVNTLAQLASARTIMKSIAQIAAQLQGYDPQALSAAAVNDFLARLVEPVRQTEEVAIFDALDRVLAQRPGVAHQRAAARQLGHGRLCLRRQPAQARCRRSRWRWSERRWPARPGMATWPLGSA